MASSKKGFDGLAFFVAFCFLVLILDHTARAMLLSLESAGVQEALKGEADFGTLASRLSREGPGKGQAYDSQKQLRMHTSIDFCRASRKRRVRRNACEDGCSWS